MRRSHLRPASKGTNWFSGRRRIIAVAATLAAFGGIVTVSQVSNASTTPNTQKKAMSACDNIAAPSKVKLSTETKQGKYADDGAGDVVTTAQLRDRCRQWVAANANFNKGGKNNGKNGKGQNNQGQGQNGKGQNNQGQNNQGQNNQGQNNQGQNGNNGQATPPPGAGLGVLANNCSSSKLPPHTGFQDGNECVSTAFGEVGVAADNPSLLITQSPKSVGVNQPFTLKVSTKNLIRDRFLAAGKGGYYVESSVLENGLVRGHFHTACRMLTSTNIAPAPDPVPAFFVATEDSKGGANADVVNINVPGLPSAGTAQCVAWAGDGSHRVPMMQRANQIPSIDSMRIQVR